MTTHKITAEGALALLRVASQHSNRKLADIALDVAHTGQLASAAHHDETRKTSRGLTRLVYGQRPWRSE
jgi:hypothetical protein